MIEKDCILWPVRFEQASYDLVVRNGLVTSTLTLNVTAGRNYWLSGDDQADAATNGGTGDLVLMLQTLLDTASGPFTVTLSSTGGLTITNAFVGTPDDWSIRWADAATTLDDAIFGFDGDAYPSGGTLTAPNQTKGIWHPGITRSEDSRDRQPVAGAVGLTMSGLARVSQLGTPKKTRDLAWDLVPQAKGLSEYAASTEPTGAFESGWLDAISKGYAFRVYDNAETRTVSSFGLYRTRSLASPMSRSIAATRFDVSLQAVRAD